MKNNYDPCEFQERLTSHLYICNSKELCQFQRMYPFFSAIYCIRAKMMETAKLFVQPKSDIEKKVEENE